MQLDEGSCYASVLQLAERIRTFSAQQSSIYDDENPPAESIALTREIAIRALGEAAACIYKLSIDLYNSLNHETLQLISLANNIKLLEIKIKGRSELHARSDIAKYVTQKPPVAALSCNVETSLKALKVSMSVVTYERKAINYNIFDSVGHAVKTQFGIDSTLPSIDEVVNYSKNMVTLGFRHNEGHYLKGLYGVPITGSSSEHSCDSRLYGTTDLYGGNTTATLSRQHYQAIGSPKHLHKSQQQAQHMLGNAKDYLKSMLPAKERQTMPVNDSDLVNSQKTQQEQLSSELLQSDMKWYESAQLCGQHRDVSICCSSLDEPSTGYYAEQCNDKFAEGYIEKTSLDPSWAPKLYLQKVISLFDYMAENDDELTFTENTTIYVVMKNEDGWWEGVMEHCTGFFPGNYVKPLE